MGETVSKFKDTGKIYKIWRSASRFCYRASFKQFILSEQEGWGPPFGIKFQITIQSNYLQAFQDRKNSSEKWSSQKEQYGRYRYKRCLFENTSRQSNKKLYAVLMRGKLI